MPYMSKSMIVTVIFLVILICSCQSEKTMRKDISSQECTSMGGEIVVFEYPEGYDPYNPPEPECSNNRENWGYVEDINCLCICCK